MKKSFLSFPKNAARYQSRRFPMTKFATVAYKEDGDDKRTEAELLEKIQGKIDTALATRATKEELEAIRLERAEEFKDVPLEALRAMADEKTGVVAMLAKQGLELTRLKTMIANQPEDMSIRSQIKKWQEANKEALEAIRSGSKRELTPLEFKLNVRTAATSPMTPGNSLGASVYLPKIEYAPGINEIIRPQPTFWDYIKKGATSSASYVWMNKRNPNGAAAFILPGVYKPGVSFEINAEISNAKKIAANEKIATELLQDIDGFASWVEMELTYQVMQKASLTLMSGAGSTTEPTGIQTLSVPFAGTGLGVKTTNPNNWDCVKACVAQLKHANFVQGEITAFMNPIDYANMVMSKAITQGQLFIPPATGATIVEDNNVPVGYLQIAMLDYYKVLIYKAFTLTYGWENDDFTKNLVTVIGEMRIHQFFSENNVGAFIYDTFANIKTGITE